MRLFNRFRVVASMIVLVALAVNGLWLTASYTAAQGDESCTQLMASAVASAQDMCGDLARGEVCYGYGGVNAGGEGVILAAAGDLATITTLDWLSTVAANPETNEWGVVKAMLPAGLPESEAGVVAYLFGAAQIARPTQVADERPTLVVSNTGTAEINLRNGAGSVGYDVIGAFAPGDTAVADGRNMQGDWVRIRYNDLIAWVFTPLVSWEGDVQALEELLPNDITASAASGEPFDAFTLTTGSDSDVCTTAPSGLMLQYTGTETASLIINGTTLEFSDAALLLSASAGGELNIKVLAGAAVVNARGIPVEVGIGEAAAVNLGGEDGFTPTAQPALLGSYAFPEIAYVPVDLLTGDMACVVGLPDALADVRVRVGPGEQRGELAQMSPNLSYAVVGWANDPDGNPWWELDTGEQTSWARQSEVRALGNCEMVAEVDAPPVVLGTQGGAAASGQAASGPDLAPAVNSVWQMQPGADRLSGECSGAPAINFCDHLAAIAPVTGGISWKGMEASPYVLSQVQPNVYSYSGSNVLGTGNINMTLTFSSETQLNMTMVLTLNSEPNCQHTYFYTGTKNW